MSLSLLRERVHSADLANWTENNERAFESLFGGAGRYPKAAARSVKLRAPRMRDESGVSFAAYIHPENPASGAYSGLSFVLFPVEGAPCLVALVVGTQGLGSDAAILGRPGHGRKVRAICSWLNRRFGQGEMVAWAKDDPTRTDIGVPPEIPARWTAYKSVFDRYGKELYAIYRPTSDQEATESAIAAFLDLFMEERGHSPMKSNDDHANAIRGEWFEHLLPSVTAPDVAELLESRRFVILQGPPGTGKTRMATELLRTTYGDRGATIQFHPNTSYENFIGGLAPSMASTDLGFRFTPTPGFFMEAAAQALRDPDRNYLLHIDEINRADLGKVLGEAILLLEPRDERNVCLPYEFGEPFHRRLFLPKNLHILGTMNSADRSIAIVDVAVRRRFGFISLWPSSSVVEQLGCPRMQTAFRELLHIFVEHASEDAFTLLPGHSYFLEADDVRAKQSLSTNLAPLLEEYLAQGYVSGFAENIRAYLQQLRSL